MNLVLLRYKLEMDKNDKYLADQQALRIASLIAGFINQTLSPAESQELDDWINESDDNLDLFDKLTDGSSSITSPAWPADIDFDEKMEWFRNQLPFKKARKKPLIKLWQLTVAASLILVVSSIIYTTTSNNKPLEKNIVTVSTSQDISPGTDKAILTLADGTNIILYPGADSAVKEKNGTRIDVSDGRLIYFPAGPSANNMLYNMVKTPRGGSYKLVLADGTRVWLNAASSIRYPAAFIGTERKVEITGEAYFEVVKNAAKPFIVTSPNGATVRVLGTHFNINAYSDEEFFKTTLKEGSVLVTIAGTQQKLIPGQQALIGTDGNMDVQNADLEETLAWKNNEFFFKDASIETIMRQVARWYDVQIVYEGKVVAHFNATIPRNVSVSKLLKLLEITNRVHFEIENKTIKVKP